jgi:hypothetical protein
MHFALKFMQLKEQEEQALKDSEKENDFTGSKLKMMS